MALGLKLFRVLALLACVSLVVAGGNWVHHAHANQSHAHDSELLAQTPHVHVHDEEHKNAPPENLIHCGSDHVWFEVAWSSPDLQEASAVGGQTNVSAIPAYPQVEKPPPRLILAGA